MASRKNLLELYVAEKLKTMYKYSRPTIGSGSTPVEKGDIKNPYFCIECKDWNTASFSIRDDVWYKIKSEAASEYKDPVYIVENSKRNKLAIMDLDDWFSLVLEVIELRKENEDVSR